MERPPVTCARSNSYCGRRNRPTAPPAPPAEAGSFLVPERTRHQLHRENTCKPERSQLFLAYLRGHRTDHRFHVSAARWTKAEAPSATGGWFDAINLRNGDGEARSQRRYPLTSSTRSHRKCC